MLLGGKEHCLHCFSFLSMSMWCPCAHMSKSQKLTSEFFLMAVHLIILRWSLTEPMAHHVAGSVGLVLCPPSATGMNML